jgi:hypothetical protein
MITYIESKAVQIFISPDINRLSLGSLMSKENIVFTLIHIHAEVYEIWVCWIFPQITSPFKFLSSIKFQENSLCQECQCASWFNGIHSDQHWDWQASTFQIYEFVTTKWH